MAVQPGHNVRADAGIVHQPDEGGPEFQIADVLGDVPADAAVNILNPARVPPAGNILAGRISLDIHKYRAENHDAHRCTSRGKETHLFSAVLSFIIAQVGEERQPENNTGPRFMVYLIETPDY
jgi:hypothetical protein